MSALRDPQRLNARLHHVCLSTGDPAGLADFYRRALGYAVSTSGELTFATATDRRLVFSAGPPNQLVCAAYAVTGESDLEALRARIEASRLELQPYASPFFGAGALACRDPDGNQFAFGIAPAAADGAECCVSAALPARIQHVVLASPNAGQLASFYESVFGFTVSDNVVDTEGGLRTTFLRCSQEHHSLAVFRAARAGLDHHCYETADWNSLRDWADRWAAEGLSIVWGPGRHGPGNNLFIFLNDPDGNWIEISAELEIVAEGRQVGRWPHEPRTLNLWGVAHLRS